MPEPKCRWCKDTRVVQLLTTVAPCTDCPTQGRAPPPAATIKVGKVTVWRVSAEDIANAQIDAFRVLRR